MATSLTADLAEWSTSVTWAELPMPVRTATVCRLVDSIGLMLAGSQTASGRAIYRYAVGIGGREEATLVASGDRLPAELAALIHGTWAHVHDFDDTEPESVIHPTSAVAAAALAVGEARHVAPEEVLAATAIGVEVICRLGVPAGRRFHHRGFHATGLAAPIATALTVSRLTKIDPDVAVDAMGLAGSMSSGLLAFLGDGSWAKRLHPGWAAHGGITAAGLASQGFRGPAAVLEDRYGLYAAFLHGDDTDPALVTEGLGTTWLSVPAHFKRYPCAHVIQPFLDAVLAAGVRAEHVDDLALRLPKWQVPIVCEPWDSKVRPVTEYQARTSLPFALASALIDGDVGIDTFDDANLSRADVADVLTRVRYAVDDDLNGFEAAVEVRLDGGTATTLRPFITEPPIIELVRAKLRRTAGRVVSDEVLARLEGALVSAGDAGRFDPVTLVRESRSIHQEPS